MYASNGGTLSSYARNTHLGLAVAPIVAGGISVVKGIFGGDKTKPEAQRYMDLLAALRLPEPARSQWIGSMRSWAARGDPVSTRVLAELAAGQHGGVPSGSIVAQPSAPAAQPTIAQEIIRQVAPELLATRQGEALIREVAVAKAEELKTAATPWLIPLAIGAGLLFLSKK